MYRRSALVFVEWFRGEHSIHAQVNRLEDTLILWAGAEIKDTLICKGPPFQAGFARLSVPRQDLLTK